MFVEITFKDSVSTAKKTQNLSVKKIKLLMLFREIIDVCSENNAKSINTCCGRSYRVLKQVVHTVNTEF
jgi:hypothetical protein